ncbi:MAG: DNA (cytosine-5-)-methyltransferase [Microcoleaceae cyanobacterium]
MTDKAITFIDLFAGIGGFRIALEKAGYHCVYSCEINPACQEVYQQNFGEIPEKDISQIEIDKIPNHDILTAGFPCQPFSICGKRSGFQDTRGTLFFHLCRIIEAKKPQVIFLENVKHLVHHDQGRTLDIILYSLEDLGYLVDYKILNAKDFGVPQNRERIVIFGTLNKKFNFNLVRDKLPVPSLSNFLDKAGNFEYLSPGEYTLIENPKTQDSGLLFVGYRNKNIWKKGIRPNTEHLSRVHRQPNRIYSVEGVHPTLPSQETSGRFFIYLPQKDAVRKLTIAECYRIMGFPTDFKIHPSLAECYKQIGNSVCINMIYELAIQLREQNLIHNNLENKISLFSRNNSCYESIQLEILGLNMMNHQEKLLQAYDYACQKNVINTNIPENYNGYVKEIAENVQKQKGVYTVLVTLLVHKILYPDQDIRYHQSNMRGGFSGQTIDTQYITPTLKGLGLPAMAESGWLTRSLEQPSPYTLDYQGNISNKTVKKAFLNIIDFVQNNPEKAEDTLNLLLYSVKNTVQANQIKIVKLSNPEKLDISDTINCLKEHFFFGGYKTYGASKLPVLAIFAIYQSLIEQVERYRLCRLKELGSHTASDRTSKSAGDIEILDKNKNIIEVVEIKHDKKIDLQMIRIAKDKIIKFNPRRYYILSSANPEIIEDEASTIEDEVSQIRREHGCIVILNGIIPTLKYYLRLINSVDDFIDNYSKLIESDTELKTTHKVKWNDILSSLNG